MNRSIASTLLLLAALGGVVVSGADAALARGGAAAIMDSPGYQRALKESRDRLQQREIAPQAAEPWREPRHGRRHRHHRR